MGLSASAADRLIADGGLHEEIQTDKAEQGEEHFERPADRRVELKKAAERPAGRPGGADKLRADEDRNGDQRGQMGDS